MNIVTNAAEIVALRNINPPERTRSNGHAAVELAAACDVQRTSAGNSSGLSEDARKCPKCCENFRAARGALSIFRVCISAAAGQRASIRRGVCIFAVGSSVDAK